MPHDGAAALAARQAVHQLQGYDEQQGEEEGRALGALWAEYGEQGTLWFHRLGKQQPEKFPFMQVKAGGQGPAISLMTQQGAGQAGSVLADYFDGDIPTGLFHPRHTSAPAQDLLLGAVDKVLSAEAASTCQGPVADGRVTVECLEGALAGAAAGKAPGCDGLPYEFYRAFWEEVRGPLVAAFNEPFLSAQAQPQLHGSALLGVIVLLYKQGGKPREDPDSYRPITLLNCDLKLVAKVMAKRLGVPLGSVVDDTQTAFVPGRWIGDNILSHLEAVEYYPAVNRSACIVGLDFAKAYDRVDRGWLGRCMEAVGLPATAVRWVGLLFFSSCLQGMGKG
jgi:hypothetical protein